MSTHHYHFRSRNPETTRLVARYLGDQIPETGLTISLVGPLGAGKTHFVKGLAEALGLDPDQVTSPTFTLVNEYARASRCRLIHADFYRVESENALEELGFLDLVSSGTVLAVEWGDRFADFLPKDRLDVEIERLRGDPGKPSNERRVTVTARGPAARKVLDAWEKGLEGVVAAAAVD